MKNGSDFKAKVDDIIQKLFEGGIFAKWNRNYRRRRKFEIPYNPSIEFKLEHISFDFLYTLGIGWSISMLMFISEIIVYRKMQQLCKSNTWIYFDQYLCGKRYYLKG